MSTATLPAAPRRTPPHRWTVPEFHRLCSLGMFAGRRPVLLNGVILEQGPMDSPHGNGVERTDTVVRGAFGAGWRFRVQLPLVLSLHTDPMPDIAVVAGALAGNPGHPTAALVIEVADTTFDTDTTEKAELYATAGIADYWVLDVDNRELHVFRDPRPSVSLGVTAYYTHSVLKPGDTISPLAVPGVAVRVADLLP
ncbi:Uma2 family endonuclease [Gemmata sp. JC717]|uniref:Uma2 family endonuclease n=1 Tax=Gemmata algarum TaxID=2975278 RepID=UPI0021BA6017|nr:Uma2 family endonuclease [Gemmata algarum]MDY3557077.1 Uma2 family endonuclease [Gemmata algarum]